MPDVPKKGLSRVLDYIYNGYVSIPKDELPEFFAFAKRFGIDSLKNSGKQFEVEAEQKELDLSSGGPLRKTPEPQPPQSEVQPPLAPHLIHPALQGSPLPGHLHPNLFPGIQGINHSNLLQNIGMSSFINPLNPSLTNHRPASSPVIENHSSLLNGAGRNAHEDINPLNGTLDLSSKVASNPHLSPIIKSHFPTSSSAVPAANFNDFTRAYQQFVEQVKSRSRSITPPEVSKPEIQPEPTAEVQSDTTVDDKSSIVLNGGSTSNNSSVGSHSSEEAEDKIEVDDEQPQNTLGKNSIVEYLDDV